MKNMSNILFICSRNQWRSPTAERIFRQNFVRSAGTSPNAKRTVSVADIKWANEIFVMEKKHKNRIVAKFARLVEHKPIHILDIPDEYSFMDPNLVSHLEDLMIPYLLHLT